MNESIEQYIEFLWMQFQYDWSVFSNPWLLYTVIPALFYLCFFLIKWWVLLAPITVPITTLTHGLVKLYPSYKQPDTTDRVKKELNKLFGRE